MLITLILVGLLIFILLFPIFIRVRVYANVLKLKAIIVVSIFKINVFTLQVLTENNKFKLLDKKGRELKPKVTAKQQKFDIGFLLTVLKMTLSTEMYNTFYGGVKSDIFKASMISGSVLSILEITKTQIKQFRKDFVVVNNAKASFNNDELVFTTDIKICINILLAVIGLLIAVFKNLFKGEKHERRKARTSSN